MQTSHTNLTDPYKSWHAHANLPKKLSDPYKRSFSYSETDVDGELAYLIVTKVPSLRGSEVRGTTDKETLENLYERRRIGRQIDHSNQDLISYEQIGYLFKREVGYAKSIAEDKYTPGDEPPFPPPLSSTL